MNYFINYFIGNKFLWAEILKRFSVLNCINIVGSCSAKNWNRGFGGAVLPALMRLSDVTLLVIKLDNLFDKQLSAS